MPEFKTEAPGLAEQVGVASVRLSACPGEAIMPGGAGKITPAGDSFFETGWTGLVLDAFEARKSRSGAFELALELDEQATNTTPRP